MNNSENESKNESGSESGNESGNTGNAIDDGLQEPNPTPSPGRVFMVNLLGAIGAGALTGLLAGEMPSWPRPELSSIGYWFMAPFLLVPPLWTLTGLAFAARTLLNGAAPGMRRLGWAGLATAVVVAALVWPPYYRAMRALLGL